VEVGPSASLSPADPLPPVPGAPQTAQERALVPRKAYSLALASVWLYATAGMTVVNAVFLVLHFDYYLFAGLNTPMVSALRLSGERDIRRILLIALSLLLAVVVVWLGRLTRRGNAPAITTALVMLAVDTAVTVWIQEWMSVLLHLLAIMATAIALRAARDLAWMQPDEIAAIKPDGGSARPAEPASKSLGWALLAIGVVAILLAVGILAVGWPWPTVNDPTPTPPSPGLLTVLAVFGGAAVLLWVSGAVILFRARKSAAASDLPHQATAPGQPAA
jgi:hypothetical protein